MAKSHQRAVSQTQLQFSLSDQPRAPRDDRLTVRFKKPAPIVIEKLTTKRTVNHSHDEDICSTFSAVSRDRLEEAIFLARRDRQRGATFSNACRQPVDRQHGQTKQPTQVAVTGAVSVSEKCVKGAARREQREPARQAPDKQKGRTVADVTAWQVETTSSGDGRPESGSANQQLSREEKQAVEIFRLRKQLQEQLIKLKTIGATKTMQQPQKRKTKTSMSRRTLFDDQAEAVEMRAVAKAEEQVARSARMLYVLQRQVHEIQDELERRQSQPRKVAHTKKSRTLSQLAAAHRAAVRAIQTFVQSREAGSYTAVSGMQQELAFLIRQLSHCCTQMNVGGADGISEMEDILSCGGWNETEMNKENKEVRHRPSVRRHDQHRDELTDKEESEAYQLDIARSRSRPAATEFTDRQAPGVQRGDVSASPERSSTLKAGLSVMRSMRQQHQRHPHHKHTVLSQRSVLLPTRPTMVLPSRSHESGCFAHQTVASQMKRRVGSTWKEKPQQHPRRQVKKGKKNTRHTGSQRQDMDSKQQKQGQERESKELTFMKRMFQQIMEKEAARQTWLDNETVRQMNELKELRHLEQERLDEIRNEMELQRKVEPVPDHSERPHVTPTHQRVNPVHRMPRDGKETLSSRLSKKAVDTALSNTDLLTETILNDLLLETVNELNRIDTVAELECEARRVVTAPTLEQMKQRMDAFELDERAIRRRWLSVQFEDINQTDHSTSMTHFRTASDNVVAGMEQVADGLPQQELRLTAYCPKRQAVSTASEGHYFCEATVPNTMLQSMESQQQEFDRYLRLTATHPRGTFNPWQLVERISEQLLEECLTDVTEEIEHICNNYVEDQIYLREFAQA